MLQTYSTRLGVAGGLPHGPISSKGPNNSRLAGRRKQSHGFVVTASKPSDAPKEEDTSSVSLKGITSVLQDDNPRAPGVLITAMLAYGAGAVQKSVKGVAAFTKNEMKAVMKEAPNTLKEWPNSIAAAWDNAKSQTEESLHTTGANITEAWSGLVHETEEANEKLAHEAEIGAENWKKTAQAITSGIDATTSSENSTTDALLRDAQARDKAAAIVSNVREQIKEAETKAKEGGVLKTGWGSAILNQTVASPQKEEAQQEQQKQRSMEAPTPTAVAPPAPPAIDAAAEVSTPPATKPTDAPASPTTARPARDASLRDATKGGRHISMLSAPPSIATTTAGQGQGAALGWSAGGGGASSASSSSSTTNQRSGNSSRDVAAAGLAASVAAVTAAAAATGGTSRGGNGNGNGGGGGGGGGGDGQGSSNNGGDEDGGSGTWFLFLLFTIAVAGGAYYMKTREHDAKATKSVKGQK